MAAPPEYFSIKTSRYFNLLKIVDVFRTEIIRITIVKFKLAFDSIPIGGTRTEHEYYNVDFSRRK